MELKYQYELQLEQLRQTGKVTTKQIENKGKKSVTKIKMGQPDDEIDELPQFQQPSQQPMVEEPEEDTQEDMMEDQMEGEMEGEQVM
jgi:hypothetical protein